MKGVTGIAGVVALSLLCVTFACSDQKYKKKDRKSAPHGVEFSETDSSALQQEHQSKPQQLVVQVETPVEAEPLPPVPPIANDWSVWWPPAFFSGPEGGDDEEGYIDDENQRLPEPNPEPCKPETNHAGLLDPTFNPNGVQPGTVGALIANSETSFGAQSAVQKDGKIVVGGSATISGRYVFSAARFLTDGSLDPTFNSVPAVTPGTTYTPSIGGYTQNNQGYTLVLQPDGKILIGGQAEIDGVFQYAFARLNTDGSLDTSFNPSGAQPGTTFITGVDGNNYQNSLYEITLQPDGKIVAVGYILNASYNTIFGIARINSDGSLDTSFNPSGIQPGTNSTTIAGQGTDDEAYSVVIKPNGKLLVGGFASISGIRQFAIAQFNSNGTLDTTFNPSGIQPGTLTSTIDNSTASNFGLTIALQKDGKIVMGGGVEESSSSTEKFAVARFNPNGSPDTSFNSSGIQPGTASVGVNGYPNDNLAWGLAIQDNGKIILGGEMATTAYLTVFAVARFLPNGLVDTEFIAMSDHPGVSITSVDNSTFSLSYSVALQEDGKILLAGYDDTETGSEVALARFYGDPVKMCYPQ